MKRITKWTAMTTGWMVENQIHARLIEGKKWYDFHTEIEFKLSPALLSTKTARCTKHGRTRKTKIRFGFVKL